MNIIVGQAATGDKFYIRRRLIESLWNKIRTGNNILITAPRRIGKTSIMLYCKDNPIENYKVIYLITESVNGKNEFFRKLVKEIFDNLKGLQKFTSFIQKLASSTKITSIGPDGFSFENKEVNYYEEFVNITEQLDLDGVKFILMVDEFAQTVENIMQDEGNSSAIKFLEAVREIRINPRISDKIQFVFSGSIGLENIVSQLNSISTINDLYVFQVPPLLKNEALDYINTIPLKNGNYEFLTENIEYLLNKLEWIIPYFINIILDEIEVICYNEEKNVISKGIINQAFINSIKNRSYFEHWHTRLRKAYKKNDYNFSKEVLNYVAQNSFISKANIIDIAIELGVDDSYKDILNALKYDGYLNNQADSEKYVFNSPLLKEWWLNFVTN